MTNTTIKEFRSDNGTEYTSNAFRQYLKDNGIKHNTSVEYCPQSNGKAEGLNRTLIERARCMILEANVSLKLWTVAVDTANYLRNRSPSEAINGKTPYELMYKSLPKIKHLKIFGCAAYPLDTEKKNDKFEATAHKNCIMVGYGDKEGIYWIYNKENNKIFRSRDVKFNEESVLTHSTEVEFDVITQIQEEDKK
jgi:hypothetical protein